MTESADVSVRVGVSAVDAITEIETWLRTQVEPEVPFRKPPVIE